MQVWLFGLIHLAASQDHFGKCHGDHAEIEVCDAGECETQECKDCSWGTWGDWGPCTCEGIQDRHRVIVDVNNGCGKACVGAKVETQKCQSDCHMAARDCELSKWSEWSQCDKTCDKGQQFRERSVVRNLAGGGKVCDGVLKMTQECMATRCGEGTDCKLSPWGPWSKCTSTCNGGQKERTRSVSIPATGDGKPCKDPISELAGCGMENCSDSVDCQWGSWVNWSACSRTCDGGEKSRSRLIEVAPRNGGKMCDAHTMSEIAICNDQPCNVPRDCVFTDWSDWSGCSCSCKGTQARTRHISVYSESGGKACSGSLKNIQPCNEDACGPMQSNEGGAATDCKIGVFGEWTSCSASCGTGQQSRSRDIVVEATNGGKPCRDTLDEARGCSETPCPQKHQIDLDEAPIDCKWEPWGEWGACSASCDGGIKQHQRAIQQMANEYGKPCDVGDAIEVAECNTEGCGCQDCEWGIWAEWGACTCTGLRERHRGIVTHYAGCGKPCEGPKATTQTCHPSCDQSPINCQVSDWGEWGECSKTSHGGQSIRTRTVLQAAANGGNTCQADLRQIRPCNEGFNSKDCEISEWDEWSQCSVSCGGGQQTRDRTIDHSAHNHGKGCKNNLSQIRGCNDEACGGATDCVWDKWTGWSACSVSCGNGQRTRDRSIKTAPREGGQLCAARNKTEVTSCKEAECGLGCVDAEWGQWSEYGLCSASCGSGYHSRVRLVLHGANHCGKPLEGNVSEFKTCNDAPCTTAHLDCEFAAWSEWGDCTCSCNGIHDRSRQVSEYARNQGKPCEGSLKEVAPCNVGACEALEEPEDCQIKEWSEWSTCSVKCGGGVHSRARSVSSPPIHGGNPCQGSLKETGPCNDFPCTRALDCQWGEWAKWDICSADCGGGQSTRYRHIVTMPSHGGKPCDAKSSVEARGCNNEPCGKMMYCGWSSWKSWSECSVSCGKGQRTRSRHMSKSTEKPTDDVLDSGILNQLSSYDAKNRFSLDDLGMVFLSGMVATSLAFVGVVSWSRSYARGTSEAAHALLANDEMEME